MKKICILVALLMNVAQPAFTQSGRFTSPTLGCVSEEAYRLIGQAISSGDDRLRDSMLGKTCVVLTDQEYSILDRGVLRTEIRVYVGDTSVDMIVAAEEVR